MRIIYMGTPEFAVAGLKALVENGKEVVAVVTMPDKPAGRGYHVQMSPVKEYALSVGLPVLQPEKLKDEAFVEELRSYHADLQIVVAFRMLPEIVWSMPELGTFNLHASLLPRYRGAAPINWAVINGDKETGVTTFMLKHEIDTGNLILQEKISIGDDENVGSVHDRLMDLGTSVILRTVELIEQSVASEQPLHTTPQDEVGDLPTAAPKIFKETCEIHLEDSALHIFNLIRGLSPYPCAWIEGTELQKAGPEWSGVDGNVKIYKAVISSVSKQQGHIILPCSDGYIDLLELQLPGKKRMDAKSLLNGLRNH